MSFKAGEKRKIVDHWKTVYFWNELVLFFRIAAISLQLISQNCKLVNHNNETTSFRLCSNLEISMFQTLLLPNFLDSANFASESKQKTEVILSFSILQSSETGTRLAGWILSFQHEDKMVNLQTERKWQWNWKTE